jgi:hypothetical protein
MKRTWRTALAAVPVAALLAGCGSGLNHGTITGKQYDPSYTYWTSMCASYSKYGACRISVPVPETEPAEWVLDLRDGKQSGTVDVDEQTWDSARTGQKYP